MDKRTDRLKNPYMKYFISFGLIAAAYQIYAGAYNNYFPIILQAGNPEFAEGTEGIAGFGLNVFMTSLIMSIDNFFAVVLSAPFGVWGDRSTKRRGLTVILGLISCVTYVFLPLIIKMRGDIPSGATDQLMPYLIITILLVFIYQFADIGRGSLEYGYQYLFIPKEHHNMMNSVMMLLGGVGFIVFTVVGSIFYSKNPESPFYLGSGMMAISLLIFFLVCPPETEKNERLKREKIEGKTSKENLFKAIIGTFTRLPKLARLCILMMLIIRLLSLMGVAALQTFASSFMLDVVGIQPNMSMIVVAVYYLGYMLAAVPVAKIAEKVNNILLFAIGLSGMILGSALMLFFGKDVISLSIFCLIIGSTSSILDVMILPYIMSFAPEDGADIGTLYSSVQTINICTSLVAVPIVGWLIDLTGNYSSLFLIMIISCAICYIPLAGLKRFSEQYILEYGNKR